MTYQPSGAIKCVICKEFEAVGRKLCRRCYNTARRDGRLDEFPVLGPDDVFLGRIKKTQKCWLWLGTTNEYGYGVFLLPDEIPVRAHRYAFEYFKGPIPDGLIVMHTCDNPPCVNPDHLRLGTKAENNADTANKKRHNYGTDHWNGSLSEAAVLAIRRSGKKTKALAKEYGVSYSHIWRIRFGDARRVK